MPTRSARVIGNLHAGQPGLPPSVPGQTRDVEERRHHRDLDRSRPGRRPQRQPVQADAADHSRVAGQGRAVSACASSAARALAFFRRLSLPILASVSGMGDQPHVNDLIGTVKVMLDAYRDGKIDRLFLVHAQFVNTMTQKPRVDQLLPVEPFGQGATAAALGLHLRAGRAGDPRRPADALHRVAGVPRRGRERRLARWPRAWSR